MLLVDFIVVVLVVGIIVLGVQHAMLTSRERTELGNLRVFKDTVRDAAINEVEIDSASSFARIVLDEVRLVDRANSRRRNLP